MNHETHQELISLYIDNTLNDKESAELFAHLAGCNECRDFMKVTMRVHAHIVEEELAEVPLSLDRRVLGSVGKKSAELKPSSWYTPVWFTRVSIPVPAAASILFLIIVGSLLFSPLLASQPVQQTEPKDPLVSRLPAPLQNELKLYK
jgi:anti-sigma factor RsiW